MIKINRSFVVTTLMVLMTIASIGMAHGQYNSVAQADTRHVYDVRSNGNYNAIDAKSYNQGAKPNQVKASKPRFATGEIIIKFKQGKKISVTVDSEKNVVTGLPSLDKLHKKFGANKMKPLFTRGIKPKKNLPQREKQIRQGLLSIYKINIKKDKDVLEAISEYKKDPNIEYAEPNYYQYTQANLPNDPHYSIQKHLLKIGAPNAWDITTGSSNVVIAILDTGVDWMHPDLSANILENNGEIDGDGLDNDGNGYIDDIRGWDFVSVGSSNVYPGEDSGPPDNNPMDFEGHGTHVAGIVGAVGNNGIGVTGVNWNVSLMPLRAGYKNSNGQGVFGVVDIAAALIYAADNGVDIVNMSFGSGNISHTQKAAIDYCLNAGVLLIAAAGNDYTDEPFYPANYENVLSVAATQSFSDERAYFTNYGIWVDVAAPGSSIYSTTVGGGYGYKSGTSMASPVVAAAAGLIKAAHPGWSADQIALQLRATASNINAANPDFVNLLGAGVVNANEAVQLTTPPAKLGVVSLWPEEQSGSIDGFLDPGETIHLKPTVRNFGPQQSDVSVSLTTTDPYVSIIDDSTFVGSLGKNFKGTNYEDPLSLFIDPSMPKDHILSLDLEITSSESGVISTDTLTLHSNPTMRRSFLIDGNDDPLILVKPDNGLVVLTQKLGLDGTFIYAKTADSSNNWSPTIEISDAPGITGGKSNFSSAVDDNGAVHVIFSGNVGSWDSELFYTYQNPIDLTWSLPVQITTNAEIFGLDIFGGHGKNAIAVDPVGNIHVVWADYRSGNAEFYYMYNDGVTWSHETIIGQTALDINYSAGLHMLFDSNSVGYLLWSQFDRQLVTNGEIHMMKLSGSIWSTPISVTLLPNMANFHLTMDSLDKLHLAYKNLDDNYGISYRNYNGAIWSNAEIIIPGRLNPSAFDIAIAPDDSIHVVYLSRPSRWTFESEAKEIVFDGSAWSFPSLLIKEQLGLRSVYDIDLEINQEGTKLAAFPILNSSSGSDSDVILLSSDRNILLSPTQPVVDDDGAVTTEQDSLHASWDSKHSVGILGYEYAIGTAPGAADLRYWVPSNSQPFDTVDLTDTPLINTQQYYFSVRAQNNNEYWSSIGVSDGIIFNTVPEPDIKINGSDGPVIVGSNANLSVTIALNPGYLSGNNADWWMWSDTPMGTYYYDLTQGWMPGQAVVTYQGSLFDLSPYEIMNMSGLPPGSYSLHFEVDTNMNGVRDTVQMYTDTVEVTVIP